MRPKDARSDIARHAATVGTAPIFLDRQKDHGKNRRHPYFMNQRPHDRIEKHFRMPAQHEQMGGQRIVAGRKQQTIQPALAAGEGAAGISM